MHIQYYKVAIIQIDLSTTASSGAATQLPKRERNLCFSFDHNKTTDANMDNGAPSTYLHQTQADPASTLVIGESGLRTKAACFTARLEVATARDIDCVAIKVAVETKCPASIQCPIQFWGAMSDA